MRNFITQNQKALAYLAEKHKVKIDFEAGAIFDYLKGMILSQSQKIVKNRKDINGLTYTKIYYSKIFNDMPLLSMKDSRGIKKRIEIGVAIGLFRKHIVKEEGNTLYYSITELGYEVLENSLTDAKEIDGISSSVNFKAMPTKPTVKSEETPHQLQSENKRTSDINFRKFLHKLKNALPNKYKLKIKDISINSKGDSLEAIENNNIAYDSWIELSKTNTTKEIIETFVKHTEVEERNSNGRYVKNIVNFLINYDEVKKSTMPKEQLKPLAVEYLNGTIEDYTTGEPLDWLVKKIGIEAVEAKYHIVGAGKYLEAELNRREIAC